RGCSARPPSRRRRTPSRTEQPTGGDRVAGPGGREVGRVHIKVVPDTDGFRRELQNAVRAAEAGLKVTIPVEFDVDTAGLRAQLAALERSRITIPVDIGDGSEIRERSSAAKIGRAHG